jgi:hypothetical protein
MPNDNKSRQIFFGYAAPTDKFESGVTVLAFLNAPLAGPADFRIHRKGAIRRKRTCPSGHCI